MPKKFHILCLLALFIIMSIIAGCQSRETASPEPIKAAVEYTDHAASFYCAQGNNLFEENGIHFDRINLYASGVKVAAAFSKEGFDVGYMCLVPAIYTYANGGVPIKIIAGTHKNGYGLVVNADKIKNIKDLEKENIIISNGPKGTVTDFMQMLLMEKEKLDGKQVLAHTVRMNAAQQIMALENKQVDAAFLPEHFATLAASLPGMKMLVTSQEIWPEMQGSVIVVSEKFLKNYPEKVNTIKKINQQSIDFINSNPRQAARIISKTLNIGEEKIKKEMGEVPVNLQITPEIVESSLSNLTNTSRIKEDEVQQVIDKMYQLGYIEKSFSAREIMASDEEIK